MDNTMPVAESTATGWLLSKGALGVGGGLGALAVASMYIPKKLAEKFPRTSAAVACGMGILFALSAGGMTIIAMGWDVTNPDISFSVGVASGVLASVAFGWIVNTIKKTEEKDLFEIAEIAKKRQIPPAKPVRRVRAGVKK
jgi:hypothetical protein